MNAPRRDLVPRPDAAATSDLTRDLAIEGRWGAGLVFLHSPCLRLICGYDWRFTGGAFVPHPLSRALITGRKSLPWMHHGDMPHVLWPRAGDRADFYAVLGTFGPRCDWGDGTEANFPGYGVMKTPRKPAAEIWEDGRALSLTVESAREDLVLDDFERGEYRFRHQPGSLELERVEEGALLQGVTLVLDQDAGRHLTLSLTLRNTTREPLVARVRASLRVLLKKLVLPPDGWRAHVDVLRSPFGFGAFTDCSLAASALADGVQFRADSEELELRARLTPSRAAHIGACDPRAAERAELSAIALGQPHRATAFDLDLISADLTLAPGVLQRVVVEFSVAPARAPLVPLTARDDGSLVASARRASEGEHPLALVTGDRHVDGLVRHALSVARALVWPNGVIATGALGYGGKSHVGQDVPFVHPLFLLDEHPLLARAARANVAFLWESASRDEGDGVQDHPCEGFDFAFIPFDPRRARFWKKSGGTGFLRQLIVLQRYLAFTGDDELVERCFAVAREKLHRTYLPYRTGGGALAAGEETQELIYALATAPEAFRAAASLARHFRDASLADRLEEATASAIADLNRPLGDGGFLVTEPIAGADGSRIEPGLLLKSATPTHPGLGLSFDVLLYNAIALAGGALTQDARRAVARELARPDSAWLVPGAGLAKEQGGKRGVWFWHNALAARALFAAADLDAGHRDVAFERLRWMGRGLADINGLGCPGEELNGGDYAMGIGCLPALAAIDGLLGLRATASGIELRPCLPGALGSFQVRNLLCRGRRHEVLVGRDFGVDRVALPGPETKLCLRAGRADERTDR